MMAARLRLASVFVVVARWSTDLNVIFIISDVRCTAMIKMNRLEVFLKEKNTELNQYAIKFFFFLRVIS